MNKILLLFICQVLFLIPNFVRAQTLHAIVVANTFDENIGSACEGDCGNVFTEIKNIAQVLNYKDNLVVVQDFDFSKQKLENAISNLQCNSNDVVLFYYTGHGARAVDDNSQWPQMSLNQNGENDNRNYVPLLRVFNLLQEKNPRLLIVLADCCNNVSQRVLPQNVTKGQTTVSDESNLVQVYRSLYNDLSGTVLASSSKPGETSIALKDQFSLFTINFFESMADALNGEMECNWNNLLSACEKRTSDFSNAKQNPQFEIRVIGKDTPVPNPPVENESVALLNKLVDRNNNTPIERLRMIESISGRVFSSKGVVVETYAANSKTLLNRETADMFVKRLAATDSVVKVIEIDSEKDESGKLKSLKVSEIVKI
ncbi:MAG: caspase family protein [Mangrovibacterium sp.]